MPFSGLEHIMPRTPYPSDLTEAQWELLAPLIPAARPGGRPRTVDPREIVNAIFQVRRNGCTGRALPHDFPPWGTVWSYCRRGRQDGTLERIHDALRVRRRAGRADTPSAAIGDSPSVQTTAKGGSGATMPPKRGTGANGTSWGTRGGCCGRGRCIPPTSQTARGPSRSCRRGLPWAGMGRLGAGHRGRDRGDSVPAAGHRGFAVRPRRWVVERTCGWRGRCRRLSQACEKLPATPAAWIRRAMTHLMLRRLA